jgi:hypothetical protein
LNWSIEGGLKLLVDVKICSLHVRPPPSAASPSSRVEAVLHGAGLAVVAPEPHELSCVPSSRPALIGIMILSACRTEENALGY